MITRFSGAGHTRSLGRLLAGFDGVDGCWGCGLDVCGPYGPFEAFRRGLGGSRGCRLALVLVVPASLFGGERVGLVLVLVVGAER